MSAFRFSIACRFTNIKRSTGSAYHFTSSSRIGKICDCVLFDIICCGGRWRSTGLGWSDGGWRWRSTGLGWSDGGWRRWSTGLGWSDGGWGWRCDGGWGWRDGGWGGRDGGWKRRRLWCWLSHHDDTNNDTDDDQYHYNNQGNWWSALGCRWGWGAATIEGIQIHL